jgi:uncharacterized protein YdhG (YjbR/CyaY superfamily)
MKKPKDVKDYISKAPASIRKKLNKIRKTIKEIAIEAEESISYGMPFYAYKGRLVYFSFMKNHIGLYIPPPIIEDHKSDLTKYKTSKSAIQFPLDKELPLELIKKLIKARIKYNEDRD